MNRLFEILKSNFINRRKNNTEFQPLKKILIQCIFLLLKTAFSNFRFFIVTRFLAHMFFLIFASLNVLLDTKNQELKQYSNDQRCWPLQHSFNLSSAVIIQKCPSNFDRNFLKIYYSKNYHSLVSDTLFLILQAFGSR